MMRHLILPGVELISGGAHPAYLEYLNEWREQIVSRADDGEVAASLCLQAAFIDLITKGSLKHDWLGVMDEHLTANGKPLAYSERFGAKLFGFGGQYLQSTVHAIHTRWWLETICAPRRVDHEAFAGMILGKKQTDGLIYDQDLSETILRHRMKSELTMSMAMSVEILVAAGGINEKLARELATNIVDPKKCPPLGYMGMEFYRLQALRLLGHEALLPEGIDEHITACAEGLEVGWCDFAMNTKVDAYMGTAKRTQRDKPIHSPLTACHVKALREIIKPVETQQSIIKRFTEYAAHLKDNPLDIPAFQMRDVPVPFGVDRTPIEVICASNLIATCKKN